jgi:hypothetical protein
VYRGHLIAVGTVLGLQLPVSIIDIGRRASQYLVHGDKQDGWRVNLDG